MNVCLHSKGKIHLKIETALLCFISDLEIWLHEKRGSSRTHVRSTQRKTPQEPGPSVPSEDFATEE